MNDSNTIRDKFLSFFSKKRHSIEQSTSLIPANDPSLLFTSAGMVPFKDMFLGKENRGFTRAASIQKCLRTSDIERVGHTNRHLTFFEMMGNFSFGDYFKEDAIAWAWEFLTKELNLPIDKLYATIYEKDDESLKIWKKHIAPDRIYKLGKDSNFWAIGETGPCGPCAEIIFDQGEKTGCGKPTCAPGCDCDRYLEVWNLVFTEFNRQKNGSLSPLPKKNIDTGMGFERLACVVQGVTSNFETDLFMPIKKHIEDLGKETNPSFKISEAALHIISDHVRAATFLLADGIFPSNEGRGYVLKRLIRRAAQHGIMHGLDDFLYKLSGTVISIMKNAYPELIEKRDFCAEVLKSEESKFKETLEVGTKLIDELKQRYKDKKHIPGFELFTLFDTYGLPLDFSKEMLENFSIDEKGFYEEMEKQKQRARKQVAGWDADNKIFQNIITQHGKTKFIGYDKASTHAKITAIIQNNSKLLDSASKQNEEIGIILGTTPFYGESGGQKGDTGTITLYDANRNVTSVMHVSSTKKPLPYCLVHYGKIVKGSFSVGNTIEATIHTDHRDAIRKNHTATHMLQSVLRKNLGSHIKQSGSDVHAFGLRFDFTHPRAITKEELALIEDEVNKAIQQNYCVLNEETDMESAQKKGALAFFDEKYDNTVRMVSISIEKKITPLSVELCGGTHCDMTGEIGFFKILSESSIASGVRRIEAVTGMQALAFVREQIELLNDVSQTLKSTPKEVPSHIEGLNKKIKQYEKEISTMKMQFLKTSIPSILEKAETIESVPVIIHTINEISPNDMRKFADMLRDKVNGIVFLIEKTSETYQVLCVVAKKVVKAKELDARLIVKEVASKFGGSGGGRPDMAQAGIKGNASSDEIILHACTTIKKIISS